MKMRLWRNNRGFVTEKQPSEGVLLQEAVGFNPV